MSLWDKWGDERGCDEGHWHAHTRGLPWGLPEVVGMVQQVHCSLRRLLRRGLEFHVCTINKSAHTKKSLETYLMILVHILVYICMCIMTKPWWKQTFNELNLKSTLEKEALGSNLCLIFPSLNPHFKLTFRLLTLSQVQSGGRQRQISLFYICNLLIITHLKKNYSYKYYSLLVI